MGAKCSKGRDMDDVFAGIGLPENRLTLFGVYVIHYSL